jgi:hypothetical protein
VATAVGGDAPPDARAPDDRTNSHPRPITISLILNIILSALVLATVLGLLMWSIVTEHRSLSGAEMHTRNRRDGRTNHAPPHPARPNASIGPTRQHAHANANARFSDREYGHSPRSSSDGCIGLNSTAVASETDPPTHSRPPSRSRRRSAAGGLDGVSHRVFAQISHYGGLYEHADQSESDLATGDRAQRRGARVGNERGERGRGAGAAVARGDRAAHPARLGHRARQPVPRRNG